MPLRDRLVSAVATGRPELIPFKRESVFVVVSCCVAFPPCGDVRYINIRYTTLGIVVSCSLTDNIVQSHSVLQYVWFVQDRLSHRLYWLHDWDCGLVVWVCAADHLEDEEASRGGQRHDTRYEWRQDAAEHEISSHD